MIPAMFLLWICFVYLLAHVQSSKKGFCPSRVSRYQRSSENVEVWKQKIETSQNYKAGLSVPKNGFLHPAPKEAITRPVVLWNSSIFWGWSFLEGLINEIFFWWGVLLSANPRVFWLKSREKTPKVAGLRLSSLPRRNSPKADGRFLPEWGGGC